MSILNSKKIKSPPATFILIFYFIANACSFAQYQKSLDSLYTLKTDIERTRGFVGSAEELKLSRADYKKYMDAARKLATQRKDKLLTEHLNFIEEIWKVSENKSHDEQIEILRQLIIRYTNENKHLLAAYCHHYLAQRYFSTHDYNLSFENYFAANEIFEKKGYQNVSIISKFLHDFALSRYYFKDYDQVIKLMHKSIKLPPYNSNHDIQRYNNLGVAYSSLGIKDSAIFYFEKTKKLGQKYNSVAWEGIISGSIGDLYYKENNYQEALKHYNIQYEKLKNTPFDPNRISSFVNIAKTQLQLGNIKETNNLIVLIENTYKSLRKNRSYGDDQQIETSKKDYYELKTNFLIKKNKLPEALKYKDSLLLVQNILDSKYHLAVVKMSSDKLIIQNKELKLAEKEEEKASQQLIYILLISGILIVGGIIYAYMYTSKRKKKRQNEKLLAQSKIVLLEKKKTEQELQKAKTEIEHFIVKLNEHGHIVSKLEDDLKSLKNMEIEQERLLNNTLQDLKSAKILTYDDWFEFQKNFEIAFPELLQALKECVPGITSSEIRYLMLIRLGFSTKEMSRALGVSDVAIRVTWSRIRKKMNLSVDETPASVWKRVIQNEIGSEN